MNKSEGFIVQSLLPNQMNKEKKHKMKENLHVISRLKRFKKKKFQNSFYQRKTSTSPKHQQIIYNGSKAQIDKIGQPNKEQQLKTKKKASSLNQKGSQNESEMATSKIISNQQLTKIFKTEASQFQKQANQDTNRKTAHSQQKNLKPNQKLSNLQQKYSSQTIQNKIQEKGQNSLKQSKSANSLIRPSTAQNRLQTKSHKKYLYKSKKKLKLYYQKSDKRNRKKKKRKGHKNPRKTKKKINKSSNANLASSSDVEIKQKIKIKIMGKSKEKYFANINGKNVECSQAQLKDGQPNRNYRSFKTLQVKENSRLLQSNCMKVKLSLKSSSEIKQTEILFKSQENQCLTSQRSTFQISTNQINQIQTTNKNPKEKKKSKKKTNRYKKKSKKKQKIYRKLQFTTKPQQQLFQQYVKIIKDKGIL